MSGTSTSTSDSFLGLGPRCLRSSVPPALWPPANLILNSVDRELILKGEARLDSSNDSSRLASNEGLPLVDVLDLIEDEVEPSPRSDQSEDEVVRPSPRAGSLTRPLPWREGLSGSAAALPDVVSP